MGLFGKLFDKKECAICGGEIGLLGNRKLEDGNLCKNCAAKLSPWFSERRHSTVAEIADQLRYREENLERVRAFRPSRVYGYDHRKLYIDDAMNAFAVANTDNFLRENPDIVDFSMLTGCVPDIHRTRWEVYQKDPDGHNVSFNPPRYRHEYDFRFTLSVNHPYFDEMSFDLNPSSVHEEEWDRCQELLRASEEIVYVMTGTQQDLSGYMPAPMPPEPQPGFGGAARPMPQGGRPMPQGNAPQGGRPMPQGNAPQGGRPMPQGNAPQGGRPMPQGNNQPQSRPTQGNAQPQGRPAQGNAQPQGRPTQGNAQQGRPAQGNAQPQGRPTQGNAQPQGRPTQGNAPQSGRPQQSSRPESGNRPNGGELRRGAGR